jgi:thioredoxin reductase (NADPH)
MIMVISVFLIALVAIRFFMLRNPHYKPWIWVFDIITLVIGLVLIALEIYYRGFIPALFVPSVVLIFLFLIFFIRGSFKKDRPFAIAALVGLFLALGIVAYGIFFHKKSSFNLEMAKKEKNIVPVAIIGGGPAGLSAAIYTARARMPTVVFGGPHLGGEILEASYVENWPGKEKLTGVQIMDEVKKQAEHFGAQVTLLTVKNLEVNRWPFVLMLDNGDVVHALTIILAMGGAQRVPDIPGVQEYWGKGIGICTICDAPYDKGHDVAVVGGGDAAADKALQLSAFANKVTILVRTARMRAAAVIQEYLKKMTNITIQYNIQVEEIVGKDGRVSGIVISDEKTKQRTTLPVQSVYFALGFSPNSQLLQGKLTLTHDGYVKMLCDTHLTSKAGVFAAGNIADARYQKAGYAAGAGIGAALDAIEFLTNLGFGGEQSAEFSDLLYKVSGSKKPVVAVENQQGLQKELKDAPDALLVFHIKQCPICREILQKLQTTMDQLPKKVVGLSIDVEKSPQLAKQYNVTRTPTIIIIKSGKEEKRFERINAKDFGQELPTLFKQ